MSKIFFKKCILKEKRRETKTRTNQNTTHSWAATRKLSNAPLRGFHSGQLQELLTYPVQTQFFSFLHKMSFLKKTISCSYKQAHKLTREQGL